MSASDCYFELANSKLSKVHYYCCPYIVLLQDEPGSKEGGSWDDKAKKVNISICSTVPFNELGITPVHVSSMMSHYLGIFLPYHIHIQCYNTHFIHCTGTLYKIVAVVPGV